VIDSHSQDPALRG